MKRLFPILLMTIFVITVNAQQYYISPIGNDATGNGSQAQPWKTLSKATSSVSMGGSVINVLAGTYTETVQLSLKAGVSISGAGAGNTIIKSSRTGQWSSFIEMDSPDGTNGNQSISSVTIDGNANTTGNSSGTWIGIAITGRSNINIHDCIFKNFYAYGVVFQGNHLDGITAKNWTSGSYATGNKFYNNSMTNCSGVLQEIQGGSGCLGMGWQDGMEVYNNSIVNTARPAGKNGWPIKFWSNGYLKGVKIHDNTLIRSPYNSPQVFGGTGEWDFAIEFFNVQGLELYNNYIQGSVDINYIYKGNYQYGLWAHHNTLNHASQNPNPESGFIFEFKAEHILVENNVLNNKFVGISYNTRGTTNNGGENNYACNYGGAIGGCSGIINNVIRNNVFSNLYPGIGATGGIITQSESTNDVQIDGLFIYNNVFSAKSSGGTYNGIDLGGMGGGSNVKNVFIRNNIFQNFRSNPIVKQSGGSETNIQISNNDFFNNTPNTISWGGATQTNNQTVNPLFVSTSDFHLQATSPLIDDGFTPLLLPSYAQAVPFNGIAPDIGYVEVGDILPPVPCTSYTYSAWGNCIGGQQTRTVVSSLPAGCTGGTPPVLTQTCVVQPVPCTSYTYSAWSACVNGTQSRTVTSSIPAGCTGGVAPVLTQTCVVTPVPCTSYTYSTWSACVNNVQTRTVVSSSPAGCTGGTAPILSQSCVSPIPADTIYCTALIHFPTTGSNTVVRNITYIVKRADGFWYDSNGTKRDVILYKDGSKWYQL